MMRQRISKTEGEYLAIHTVATMSWTYLGRDSNFEWLLLAPAAAWLLGFVSCGAGSRAEHAIAMVPQIKVVAPK